MHSELTTAAERTNPPALTPPPKVKAEAGGLAISWSDGTTARYPFLWLKDADPSGFHPDTGERAFDLTSIPLDIQAESAGVDGETLWVKWPGAEAPSRFDIAWIKAHRPGARRADPAAVAPTRWRADIGPEGILRASAEHLLGSKAALLDWLTATKRTGLSIVTGLPDDPDAGTSLARRIGHLRETNFGVIFDVVSKPDPNNLAYTADALPLHTDLTNQDLPPGYQFLHCLTNAAAGGGSTYCDGAAVAEDLRIRDPDAFDVLASVKVPFRFFDAETDIRSRKTVIGLDEAGGVLEICFNAHIADILDLDPDQMPAFYRAYRILMAMTRDPAYTVSLKLSAGEMAVFDNRRILHGREAFDPSTGARHFRGCYVDRGEWDSRIRVLTSDIDAASRKSAQISR